MFSKTTSFLQRDQVLFLVFSTLVEYRAFRCVTFTVLALVGPVNSVFILCVLNIDDLFVVRQYSDIVVFLDD